MDGFIAGALMYCAGRAIGNITKCASNCFIAGTLVLTELGHKAIENIEAGDQVWAYNEKTGENELKEVVQTFRNKTEEWVHVHINDEEITCTKEHPFYVLNIDDGAQIVRFEGLKYNESNSKGNWVEAKNLKVGMELLLSNGDYGIISLLEEELEKSEVTYNFEVRGLHNYYVGESNVLVHNDCITDELTRLSNEGNIFDCEGVTNQMEGYLESQGVTNYQRVNIQTIDQGNVLSRSANTIISKNGYHVGIEYNGLIYDNLRVGVKVSQWASDFIVTSTPKIYLGARVPVSTLFGG